MIILVWQVARFLAGMYQFSFAHISVFCTLHRFSTFLHNIHHFKTPIRPFDTCTFKRTYLWTIIRKSTLVPAVKVCRLSTTQGTIYHAAPKNVFHSPPQIALLQITPKYHISVWIAGEGVSKTSRGIKLSKQALWPEGYPLDHWVRLP